MSKWDEEITFDVRRDEESGWLVASWDDPVGGGITTQGRDLRDLQEQITEAVAAHFEENVASHRIHLRARVRG